jgi:parvulin-like peptidyl-prolyl isomerase
MRYQVVVATALLAASLDAQTVRRGADQALPVRNGRSVVAAVNSDSISLDEFLRELESPADATRLRQGRGTAKDLELLDRLVNIKLIFQEAGRTGLVELPEIRKQVEVTSREILREVLFERLVKDVKPDAAALEKLFREQVREWKTTSLLFLDEAAARRAQKEIAGGAIFADVAARAAAAKAARTDGDNAYHPKKDYLPQIAEALAKLQVGQVSPVIRLQAGFVVVKVVDVRYPENPEARAEARKQVLSEQQQAALKAREDALRRDHITINKAVLGSIDYTAATPGIDALLKDQRVVAQIKGAPPVTVGDLTDYLRLQYFHGTDQAAQRKQMNARKETALDATLGRRLWNMEALRTGIDKTNAYRDRVTAYKESLVFDSFVQKVIAPANKLTEDEARRHYNTHLNEYSTPEMIKLRSLAFTRRGAAEGAMQKLRGGADFGWLAANAEGQVPKGAEGLLVLNAGQPVTTSSMPEGMRKAVAGPKAGEFRLYPSPEGYFYVLAIQQVIAPTARPYDEVRDEIAKKVYGEKLKKAVEAYAGKLRAQSKVETYLKRVQ